MLDYMVLKHAPLQGLTLWCFVPMLDYMVLKHLRTFYFDPTSFVPMLDYMVLKPQTQILVSVHKPHFSVAKSTVFLY